jgi:hypothetical protein
MSRSRRRKGQGRSHSKEVGRPIFPVNQVRSRLHFLVVGVGDVYGELFAHAVDRLAGNMIRAVRQLRELHGDLYGITRVTQVGGDLEAEQPVLLPVKDRSCCRLVNITIDD